MAKRLLDLSNEESQLRKKIKLENELILDQNVEYAGESETTNETAGDGDEEHRE